MYVAIGVFCVRMMIEKVVMDLKNDNKVRKTEKELGGKVLSSDNRGR